MSGIAGIIRFDGAPVEPGLVEKMTSAMSHRGPDGLHHWVRGSVALGQCMLRTTPESLEEEQPLANEDESLVLVMDGRVDNWEELRKELLGRGAVLRNRSDAELVLRSYEIWGRECLPHIDGDFALVIWDARRRTAFCARDRMGNKPFNYHWDGRALAFSSELHTILRLPWVKQELHEGMLAEFLAAEWYSRDETFWRGVMRLVAAHRMEVSEAGPRTELYWEPDLSAELPFKSDEEYIDHYRELFADTVRRMSRSHRTVAFEVSGGLDSSAVFCMADSLDRAGTLPAPAVEGYTLAFDDDTAASELTHARAVGQHVDRTVLEVQPTEMPLSWYAESARRFQEFPGFTNGTMFLGLRAKAHADGCRVVQTGEGGDQWFSGDRLYYAEALADRNWRFLLDRIMTDAVSCGGGNAVSSLLRHGVMPLLPAPVVGLLRRAAAIVRRDGDQRARVRWLSPPMEAMLRQRREQRLAGAARQFRLAGQRPLMDALSDAFTDHVMERMERLSAGQGLENRYPLRAPHIVQFALSLPDIFRLRGNTDKYIHVRAMDGLLPESVLNRRSKAEFSSVARRHLDAMRQLLADRIPAERETWLTRHGLERLYGIYRRKPNLGWPLWILWSAFACEVLLPCSPRGAVQVNQAWKEAS